MWGAAWASAGNVAGKVGCRLRAGGSALSGHSDQAREHSGSAHLCRQREFGPPRRVHPKRTRAEVAMEDPAAGSSLMPW